MLLGFPIQSSIETFCRFFVDELTRWMFSELVQNLLFGQPRGPVVEDVWRLVSWECRPFHVHAAILP